MTPKEKAKELVYRYKFVEIANYTSLFEVKQCALIAVDEILRAAFYSTDEIYNFYIQVKQEIEKL